MSEFKSCFSMSGLQPLFKVSEAHHRGFKALWPVDGQYLVQSIRRRAGLTA